MVRGLGDELRNCSRHMSMPSRRRTCSITTISCSTGRRWPAKRSSAEHLGGRFDHVLVDEYQDTNRLQASYPALAQARRPGANRRGRRCSIDLFVSRSGRSKHSGLSEPVYETGRHHHARSQLSVHRCHSVGSQCRNWRSVRPFHQEPLDRAALAPKSRQSWPFATRQTRQILSAKGSQGARSRNSAKSQAVLFRASHHSGPLEIELTRRNIPFVKFGGLKFLDASHVKDLIAVLRFAENPRDRVAAFRVLHCCPASGRPRRHGGRPR